jgi:hypothetical protein
MMKRCRIKELHESPHCPKAWRDGMTNFLAFFVIYSGVYRHSVPLVDELLRKSGVNTIVDLCAGNGFYMLGFLNSLRELAPDRNVQAALTDRYPNMDSSLEIAKLDSGSIKYFSEPIDAVDALHKLPGVHVMFSALHHFDEEELTALLKTAAAEKRPVAFFDYSRRNLVADLLPLLLVPFLILLMAPLIRPFSWRQLFFIYVIPAIPLLVMVDGFISRLRSYNCHELNSIINKLGDVPDYHWQSGKFNSIMGLCTVRYIVGSSGK